MDFQERYPETISSVADACWARDAKTLRHLLAEGRSVDSHDNQGWFPVHVATHRGSADCLTLVLDAMAADDTLSIDADVATYDGGTALMLAAGVPSPACLSLLMAAGADPTLRSLSGWSALHAAAAADSAQAVRQLLRYGAGQLGAPAGGGGGRLAPLLESGDDCYPLLTAALEASAGRDVLTTLLDAGAALSRCDAARVTPLMVAALGGRHDAVALFCRRGLTEQVITMRDSDGRTALDLLLAARADRRPPSPAASLALLLDRCGAGVCRRACRQLAASALRRDAAAMLTVLLDRWPDGASSERDRLWLWRLLWQSAVAGRGGCLDALLQHVADVDAARPGPRDNLLGPLLRCCVTRGQALVALRLLERDVLGRLTRDQPDSLLAEPAWLEPAALAVPGPVTVHTVRRHWKLLGAVHRQMSRDPSDWQRVVRCGSRLTSAVAWLFCSVRAFADLSPYRCPARGDQPLWLLDATDGHAGAGRRPLWLLDATDERLRASGRQFLEVAMQVTTRRASPDEADALHMPPDLVCQPPPLQVIARVAIYRQVREAVRSRPAAAAKVATEVERAAALLPAGLRPLLLMRDGEMRRRLAAVFAAMDDLLQSSETDAQVQGGAVDSDGACRALWPAHERTVDQWESSDDSDGLW